jgi:hypothetical protein
MKNPWHVLNKHDRDFNFLQFIQSLQSQDLFNRV